MFTYKEDNMDLIQQHRADMILQRTERKLQDQDSKHVSTLNNQKKNYKSKVEYSDQPKTVCSVAH